MKAFLSHFNHTGFMVVLLMIASCSQEQKPNAEDLSGVISKSTSFTAIMEPLFTDASTTAKTRVYNNESLQTLWETGDRISVFNRESINREYLFSGNPGENVCVFDAVDKEYDTSNLYELSHVYAVYPYKESTAIDADGVITYHFPADQTWREGMIGPGANTMIALSDNNELCFKNLGSLLILSLYGDGMQVSSITFEGNNGESIAGVASITATGSSPSSTFIDYLADEAITLHCLEPVTLGATVSEATDFYMIIPPTEFTKGFTITVTAPNGSTFVKKTDKNLSFIRNKVSRMAALQISMQMATLPIPEKIDMNTASGAKWGSFNVGASAPEEYGNYYAWGETEPKESYSWDNYKYGGSKTTLTKYNTLSDNGIVDNKLRLDQEDDVAYVQIGGQWRMPTMEEQNELLDETLYTWTWTSINDVNGYEVTCKSNDNSIFIPAAGFINIEAYNRLGTGGDLWSESLFPGNDSRFPLSGPWDSYSLLFSSSEHAENQGSLRYFGRTVRPVYGNKPIVATSVSISESSTTILVGNTIELTAVVEPSNVTYQGIVWTSDDPTIATVTQDGIVEGINVGTTTIRAQAKYGCLYAICSVTVNSNGIQAIDLGLSSGIKWASWNVGATKPEERGNYYAWGETSTKTNYSSSTYKFRMWDMYYEGAWVISKYRIFKESYGTGTLSPDNKTTLELQDDAARTELGGNWRMPTKTEMQELINQCTWTWTSVNGIPGYRIQSKNNSNSIFLPAGGYKSGTSLSGNNTSGKYWSSSLSTSANSKATNLSFSSSSKAMEETIRYNGYLVRAVKN